MKADRNSVRKDPMIILWVAENRGVIAEVARQCNCTPQFVGYCLYGMRKSGDGKVERLLREAGAKLHTNQ